ncbi:tetratricopeptide repeat protein [Desulfitobacterium metallireducens]|uniref:Uncharacterized protein n=1 Tax=Desulfitobacterium metallireducens DSM 15288 TaxID=871968 RepID=W0EBU5_9FIRM|nr:tetratricopeptide repeat protein [Desulfitobacterium metallireducens]AHF08340.1 hypothetical protein DESME_15840 [Desulfitobacterium metallireducens DSM 15288]
MNQEYEKGLQFYLSGQYREAERAFLESIHTDPNHALSYNKLGLVYIKMGSYTKAKTYFNEALVHNPRLVHSWNNLGNLARHENKLEEAREFYSKALELEPNNPIPKRNLIQVEKQLKINPVRFFRKFWKK